MLNAGACLVYVCVGVLERGERGCRAGACPGSSRSLSLLYSMLASQHMRCRLTLEVACVVLMLLQGIIAAAAKNIMSKELDASKSLEENGMHSLDQVWTQALNGFMERSGAAQVHWLSGWGHSTTAIRQAVLH